MKPHIWFNTETRLWVCQGRFYWKQGKTPAQAWLDWCEAEKVNEVAYLKSVAST